MPLEFIEVRVARDTDELEKAFALVYREYLRKGYTDKNSSGLRLSLHNALPDATTFIALSEKNVIIATATIVPDSFLGLPMDTIYYDELNRLRKIGARLCEVSMLAVDTRFFNQRVQDLSMGRREFMFSFFKVLLDYSSLIMNRDDMCIAIHPKHNRIFSELLFRNLGPVKMYPEVNYAPAIGKYVNMRRIKEGFSKPGKERLYDTFVRRYTDPGLFSGRCKLSPQDLRYFFVERNDTFKRAPQYHLEFIQRCYASGGEICCGGF